MTNSVDDSKLDLFKAFCRFIGDLNVLFGKKYIPVAKYNRLLQRTADSDILAINRHIKAIKLFLKHNPSSTSSAILSTHPRIEYSSDVYIDMSKVFASLAESHDTIFTHLRTIQSMLPPTETNATSDNVIHNVTVESSTSSQPPPHQQVLDFLNLPTDTEEGRFLNDNITSMMQVIQQHQTNGDPNPMAMISGLMQSGFLQQFMQDFRTRVQDGNINLPQLMNTMIGAVRQANAETAGNPDVPDMSQVLNMLTATANNVGSGDGSGVPDMSVLLNMLGNIHGTADSGDDGGNPAISTLVNMLGSLSGNDSGSGNGSGNDNARVPDMSALMGLLQGNDSAGMPDMSALMGMLQGNGNGMPDMSAIMGLIQGATGGNGESESNDIPNMSALMGLLQQGGHVTEEGDEGDDGDGVINM